MPATYNIYNSNLHFRNNAEQPNPVGQDSWGTTTATDHQQRPSSKPWQMPLRAQTVTSKPWRHPVQQSSATQGSWAPAATWETPPATNWEQRPTSQPWRNPAQNNSNSNANKGPWSMPQNAGIVEHAAFHHQPRCCPRFLVIINIINQVDGFHGQSQWQMKQYVANDDSLKRLCVRPCGD
ncbi:uncharacterized protein KY384_005348 [Bacidia gigantensis]|uniref:uncharacterized protein n=1 Tax=Bacidia gigantensis TaxID=2732470 RepID=UPI001D03F8E8|nr:uncharacterized protein KY384_005348 [Bacidia gigantensis]KAG8529867.1 hypothetical protein KY384_005348 [Bacidia gigantensis]